jgi:hypothetical protein
LIFIRSRTLNSANRRAAFATRFEGRYLLGLAQDWYEAEDKKERQELRLETFINWTWLEYSSFADDGSYSLWFYDEDGKIFAGHVITAEYDAEGQFKAQAFTANA